MKAVIALTLLGLASIAYFGLSTDESAALNSQFEGFIQNYRANYASEAEYDFRLKTFKQNLERMEQLRKDNPRATFGVNKFADRTPEEMSAMMTKRTASTNGSCKNIKPSPNTKSVSWKNFMGTAKDQGGCGSCWAFATAAVAEGRYALFQGDKQVKTRFSEQSLIDCDTSINNGCYGGVESYAFQFWESHDIPMEKDYTYDEHQNRNCKKTPDTGIRVKTCTNLRANNAEIVTELQTGPIDIGVDASIWSSYSGGILDNCTGRGNNHAVTLTCFDADKEIITIRNSWGADWGENGSINLAYNSNGCGWQNDVHSIYFE